MADLSPRDLGLGLTGLPAGQLHRQQHAADPETDGRRDEHVLGIDGHCGGGLQGAGGQVRGAGADRFDNVQFRDEIRRRAGGRWPGQNPWLFTFAVSRVGGDFFDTLDPLPRPMAKFTV